MGVMEVSRCLTWLVNPPGRLSLGGQSPLCRGDVASMGDGGEICPQGGRVGVSLV